MSKSIITKKSIQWARKENDELSGIRRKIKQLEEDNKKLKEDVAKLSSQNNTEALSKPLPVDDFISCTTDEQIKNLISKGKDINAFIGKTKTITTLHMVARDGNINLLELLLSNGAKVNVKTFREGNTPLHVAARKNKYFECCRILIKHGADVDAMNYEQETPLFIALRKPGIFKLLLDSGASINTTNVLGDTILHISAFKNIIGNVAHLLQYGGIDVNIRNNNGHTPLMLAAQNDNNVIINLLIDFGADINAADIIGRTALDHADNENARISATLLKSNGAKSYKYTKDTQKRKEPKDYEPLPDCSDCCYSDYDY